MTRSRREAEGVVKEARAQEQEMQALRLEVEELEKGLGGQQQQVRVSLTHEREEAGYVC